MTNFPKISIITPSYNQDKFIEETILSVLNQNYPNLEYIIMDGKSNDNSVEIIKKYEKYLTYWVSEKDNGQVHAVNKGLRIASGEIIGWLNSDDTYLPDTFNIISKTFKENPDFEVIYGDQVLTDYNGNYLRIKHELSYSYNRLIYHMYQSQPATFFRKNVIDSVGYLDEKYYYSMDKEFFLRVGNHCKVKHIPVLLATYRLHTNSKSVSYLSQKSREEINEIFEKYLPQYSNNRLVNKLYLSFYKYYFKIIRLFLIFRDNPINYIKYLQYAKSK